MQIAVSLITLGFALSLAQPASAAAVDAPAADKSAQQLVALAGAYARGDGVARSERKAAALYCDAARAGDAEASFTLGWIYANGTGVARDVAAASALFARAAALGHTGAEGILAVVGDTAQTLPRCMSGHDPALDEPVARPQADIDIAADDALQDRWAALSPSKRSIAEMILRVAPTYKIDPRLALALITVESNFQPLARSPKDARGLMQLTADTAARFNVLDPWDLQQNVRGGLTFLRWLLAYYEGEVALAMAAYNAGEAAVDRHGGIPPYPETREYVRRVQRLFASERHPYDAKIARPSPIVAKAEAAR
jgi:TPR repeat protein